MILFPGSTMALRVSSYALRVRCSSLASKKSLRVSFSFYKFCVVLHCSQVPVVAHSDVFFSVPLCKRYHQRLTLTDSRQLLGRHEAVCHHPDQRSNGSDAGNTFWEGELVFPTKGANNHAMKSVRVSKGDSVNV